MMRILFVVFLFGLGCTVSKEQSKHQNSFDITGRWEIDSKKQIGDPEAMDSANREFNLFDFFGVPVLYESEGKTIEFVGPNSIKTNLISQKAIEKLQFNYQFNPNDSLIIFSFVNQKDSSTINMPTKIGFQSDVMIWNIGDYMALRLYRID